MTWKQNPVWGQSSPLKTEEADTERERQSIFQPQKNQSLFCFVLWTEDREDGAIVSAGGRCFPPLFGCLAKCWLQNLQVSNEHHTF